jgi:hypothetical protein
VSEKAGLTWAERQALPGPRRRFIWASVVPQVVPANDKGGLTLIWPRKGQGHTFVRYSLCAPGAGKFDRREVREMLREFDVVDTAAA